MTETNAHQDLQAIEPVEVNDLPGSLVNSSVGSDKQFTPVSRREFAMKNNVTPAYIGKLVKQLATVWEPIDSDFNVLTPDDKITSDGQAELIVMMAEKPAKYQKRVWEEYDRTPQLKSQKPESKKVLRVSNSSALTVLPQNEFGLEVGTKASDRLELIQAEIVESKSACDADLEDFLALSTEIEHEDQAASELDDAEFALLRKKNAQKWLKRRAILERDKQQILQGDLPQLQRGKES